MLLYIRSSAACRYFRLTLKSCPYCRDIWFNLVCLAYPSQPRARVDILYIDLAERKFCFAFVYEGDSSIVHESLSINSIVVAALTNAGRVAGERSQGSLGGIGLLGERGFDC